MIYEYAIDPSILSTWQIFKQFIEGIGSHHGRLLALLPDDWDKLVMDACSNEQSVKQASIFDKLQEIRDKSVIKRYCTSGRNYDESKGWLDNAELEHGRRPFRAIIAPSNPDSNPCILTADEATDDKPPWKVSRCVRIPSEAATLADCLALFLELSTELVFVDPYFDPEKDRFSQPLEFYLAKAVSDSAKQLTRIEYHVSDKLSKNKFESNCKTYAPKLIPRKHEVLFVQWKRRDPGEKFHARYILSDIGGICFDPGLDVNDEKSLGGISKLELVDGEIYKKLWDIYDYSRKSDRDSVYEYVSHVPIEGIK